MKNDEHALSTTKKQQLEASINKFKVWLQKRKKLCLEGSEGYSGLNFPDPSAADWIMKVDGAEVQFNTYVTNQCSFEYFRMVVLHECFHLFVQHLPNKSDAKRLKDDFGDGFMKLLDIEADYYTAMYYKEVDHFSLVDIFTLFHEGSTIFGDPRIRAPKVERFIGAVLSIANAYFRNPTKATKEKELYLPNISGIPMEESIHILISRGNHFMVGEIHADLHDLANIKKCYTQVGQPGVRNYVETLLQFASKALGIPVPPAIYKQFLALQASGINRAPSRPVQALLWKESGGSPSSINSSERIAPASDTPAPRRQAIH